MLEYKQSQTALLPVRFFDSSGAPISGIASGSVTATIEKSDGTTAAITVTGLNWAEVSFGAFASQGKYDLTLAIADTNLTGPLAYAVAAAGAVTYIGIVKVVANEEGDTFSRLGLPSGLSMSADISAIKVDTTIIGTVGTSVAAIATQVTRALGLMHENSVLDQTVYNASNKLTSGRLRIYDSKANAQLAAGGGLVETYTITATYTGDNVLTYTVVLE